MSWHVEPALLAAYARGDVDTADAYSVEAHVVGCESCQATVGTLVSPLRLDAAWNEIVDRLDAPRPRLAETLLERLGVRADVARLIAVTPAFTLSWFGAVAIALAVAVVGSYQGERGLVVFLCVAALAPVAGVAATFARGIDPTHELSLAAPTSSVRVLLLRTVAVVTTTVVVTAVAALALPGLAWTASAWLVPSLALTLSSLALATYVSHLTAFGTVAGLWVAGTIAGAARPGDALAVFDGGSQLAFAALLAVATVVLVRRGSRLDGWSA
ncbi:zf-HC2 domain-containing protein [Solirubrobacter soli]|uniref:zf-HC2 domain-containing protein n=1 Tax=Solirubrobacter soli TaxID=363832 RepID=UPI00040D1688|nr:zf-HC2 domain-containing protein [Solirubrobacter soli]